MGRSKSLSPAPRRRDRARGGERSDRPDRDRDTEEKDRERDRRRKRSRSRDRDRRRRSSRSRRQTRSRSSTPKESTSRALQERPAVTDADLEGKTPDEQEMMRMMGFCGFDTTKGKKVTGNNAGDVHVILKRKYRQYMNRKGGFNRPLDFVA